jgi:hypothetical protein
LFSLVCLCLVVCSVVQAEVPLVPACACAGAQLALTRALAFASSQVVQCFYAVPRGGAEAIPEALWRACLMECILPLLTAVQQHRDDALLSTETHGACFEVAWPSLPRSIGDCLWDCLLAPRPRRDACVGQLHTARRDAVSDVDDMCGRVIACDLSHRGCE